MDEVLHVLQTPKLWPEWPYLRVERRTELRPDSPFCLLFSSDLYEVAPTIYFLDTWPPGGWFTPNEDHALMYSSMEEVRKHGWKPFFLLEQTVNAPR